MESTHCRNLGTSTVYATQTCLRPTHRAWDECGTAAKRSTRHLCEVVM